MNHNIQDINIQYFRKFLLYWNRKLNKRKMPWKGEKNPYRIWLSEIILQQTRVEQGLKYYEKYIYKYPTIQHLANASDDNVLKDWEGLGYYSRCRNLLVTARFICDKLNGIFPTTFEDILALKGVGTYTASAIASFAYDQPYAVVDGNVVRVISRYLADKRPYNSLADKKHYQDLANGFISKRYPAEFNQAIMDFGATVCKPQNPLCVTCGLRKKCTAFAQNKVDDYPVKKKKIVLKKRYFHYLVLHDGTNIYLRKRGSGDIWQALYEPIIYEQKSKPTILSKSKPVYKTIQKLSHQELYIKFYVLDSINEKLFDLSTYKKVALRSLSKKAYPKSVFDFFKELEYI